MAKTPLISILIPFKNTAVFLKECLESIIAQSYTNWEVLAINDHSTDTSNDIVNSFAKKDDRIKVLLNKGEGIITALRTAHELSNGDYITRMDSDDIMTPNKLSIMVNSLLQYGKGHVAIGQVKYFSDNGVSDGYLRYEKWLNGLTLVGKNYSDLYRECVIPSPCWMVHKEDLDAAGAFNYDDYPEDYDLTFRFYEHKLKCIPCSEVLHYWRDYETRASRTSEHYAQNYFLELKLKYFLKLDYNKNYPLTIWGAGKKGKATAKSLLEKNVSFIWLCDNPKKIGKQIYGVELVHFKALDKLVYPQSIITVANEKDQATIHEYFNSLEQYHGVDYFFFC